MLDGVVAGEVTSRKSRTAWKLQPLRNQPTDAHVTASLVENGEIPAGQLDLVLKIEWKNSKIVSLLIVSVRSGQNEEHGLYRGSTYLEDCVQVFRANSPHGTQPEKIAGSIVRMFLKPDGSFGSPEWLETFRTVKIGLYDLTLSLAAEAHLSVGVASDFASAQPKACTPEAFSLRAKGQGNRESPPEWWHNRVKYAAVKEANPIRLPIRFSPASKSVAARRKRREEQTLRRPGAFLLPPRAYHPHHHYR